MRFVSSSNQKKTKNSRITSETGLLALIWFFSAVCDRLWFSLDRSAPAWDQADYLNGALNYWHALQTPNFLDSDWWRSFWLLSNKIPPLHYILTAPFLSSNNLAQDRASLVLLVYSGLLIISVYGLGKALFSRKVGLYAVIICQLLPGLYYYRLEFLLDYPLTAITCFCFWLLTLWQLQKDSSWLMAIALGIVGGLSLLLKQTAIFFLLIPLLWLVIYNCKKYNWHKLGQILGSIFLCIAICYPWYRTNWLLILTSSKRATVDSAIIEGDPALNTLDAWVYYLKTLPYLVSWSLLIIPLLGLLLYGLSRVFNWQFYRPQDLAIQHVDSIKWLLIYLISGYLLSSFNINKDARYILPLLPVIALFLALGLASFSQRWQKFLVPGCLGLGIALMLLNIFPLPGAALANILSPKVEHYPYRGKPYPHPEIIQTIVNTEPYLRHTLGVLPSTPNINQHNFSFYGAGNSFQLVGRQVGVRTEEIEADARSLSWFLTKTGDQGSVPEAQKQITQLIQTSPNFELFKTWEQPDSSQLKLYKATQPPVLARQINGITDQQVKLQNLEIPDQAQPNSAIPVKFTWQGQASELANGIVLLSWYSENKLAGISDRAISFGMLAANLKDSDLALEITENAALEIPENIPPGEYQLTVTYLNRQTLKSYSVPNLGSTITVTKNAPVVSAPELDLVTQLNNLAPQMGKSIDALDPIFAQTARINQYDGKQDYLQQAEIALQYRLDNNLGNAQQQQDWRYTIALSQVLQQDVQGAIATWQEITELQPENPYPFAYLAFVYLYNWQPRLAQQALDQAEQIQPNIPEVKTLRGVAAVMQGKFIIAWKLLS